MLQNEGMHEARSPSRSPPSPPPVYSVSPDARQAKTAPASPLTALLRIPIIAQPVVAVVWER